MILSGTNIWTLIVSGNWLGTWLDIIIVWSRSRINVSARNESKDFRFHLLKSCCQAGESWECAIPSALHCKVRVPFRERRFGRSQRTEHLQHHQKQRGKMRCHLKKHRRHGYGKKNLYSERGWSDGGTGFGGTKRCLMEILFLRKALEQR